MSVALDKSHQPCLSVNVYQPDAEFIWDCRATDMLVDVEVYGEDGAWIQ